LQEDEYYRTHLGIINNFIPVKMTNREIDVLAAFMVVDNLIRFETKGKRLVKSALGLSNGSLGNHLKRLRDKKFIIKLDNSEIIPNIFFPESDIQYYNFLIKKEK